MERWLQMSLEERRPSAFIENMQCLWKYGWFTRSIQ